MNGKTISANLSREAVNRPVNGQSIDLLLDLDKSSFFIKEDPDLTSRVRQDLKLLRDHLLEKLPGATILLAGSFSVGEGRYRPEGGRNVIQSDYDLVAVTPSFFHALPYLAKKRLALHHLKGCLSTRVDLILRWRPFLEHGWMSTGGKIIGGKTDLEPILMKLTPPRPQNKLEMAHFWLAKMPDSTHPGFLMNKALRSAAQALLLYRYQGSPRTEWIQCSSLHFCSDRIGECTEWIGGQGVGLIRRALRDLQEGGEGDWNHGDRHHAMEILQKARTLLPLPPCWHSLARHAFFLYRKRKVRWPNRTASADCIRGLALLVEAWEAEDQWQKNHLAEACRIATRFCGAECRIDESDPRKTFKNLFDLFGSFVVFYPNTMD